MEKLPTDEPSIQDESAPELKIYQGKSVPTPQNAVFVPVNGNQLPQLPQAYTPPQAFAPTYPQLAQPAMNMPAQPQPIKVTEASHSVWVKCQFCGQNTATATEKKIGVTNLAVGGIMCAIGLGICSWVPCCIDELKDTVHHCQTCGNVAAVAKRHDQF